MKTRNGFVSNSSSSSFVVSLKDITAMQESQIRNHIKVAKAIFDQDFYCEERDAWHIVINGDLLKGHTIMDNFDMNKFLEVIGVDLTKVQFDTEG